MICNCYLIQFTHLKYTKFLADKYICKKIILKLEVFKSDSLGCSKQLNMFTSTYIVHLFKEPINV